MFHKNVIEVCGPEGGQFGRAVLFGRDPQEVAEAVAESEGMELGFWRYAAPEGWDRVDTGV